MLGMTPDSPWIATAVGLAGGVALAIGVAKALLPRFAATSQDPLLIVRLAFAGTVVAVLPALFLSVVVGGTLGGALGRQLSEHAGLGSSGASFGLGLGTTLVFAFVLVGGIVLGACVGRAVLLVRERRARS
jgi:hypothetical protein